MKKIRLLLAALLATSSLSAMYQSNPLAPEMIDDGLFLCQDSFVGIKVGFQHDQVYNRRLKKSGSGQVDHCEILADQGLLIANFFDKVEVYGSAGAANFNIKDKFKISVSGPTPASAKLQYNYATHNQFLWGAGGRVSLFSWGCTTFGASGGYQWTHPHLKWNTIDGVLFPDHAHFRYSEWQLALGFAHRVDMFIPYIGGSYSRAKASLRRIFPANILSSIPANVLPPGVSLSDIHFSNSIKMHSKEYFGLTVGCDFSTGRLVDLGVEVRMFSEQAITLRGDLKF